MRTLTTAVATLVLLTQVALAETEGVGQAQLVVGRNFTLGNQHVYAETNVVASTNGLLVILGYLGPTFSLGRGTLYALTGPAFDSLGQQGLNLSLWYDFPINERFTIFLAGETYFPIVEGGFQWFAASNLKWRATEELSLGFRFENFGVHESHVEMAVGPTLWVQSLRFWAAYDTTPTTPNNEQVLVRMSYFF